MWDLKEDTIRLTTACSVHTTSRFKERLGKIKCYTSKMVHFVDLIVKTALIKEQCLKSIKVVKLLLMAALFFCFVNLHVTQ